MTDEQEIKQLQQEWMQAWLREDRPTLERILAPEYQLIVSSMPDRPISRGPWLGLIGRYTAQGFEYDKMVVRVFGAPPSSARSGTSAARRSTARTEAEPSSLRTSGSVATAAGRW